MFDRLRAHAAHIALAFLIIFVIVTVSTQHAKARMLQEEISQRNAYVILMPLIELCAESGIAYDTAIVAHYELLKMSIEEIEKNKLPLPARLFSFSRKKIDLEKLKEIQEGLTWDSGKDKDGARVKINEARKLAAELLIELKKLIISPITISRQKGVPAELQEKVDGAFEQSHNKVMEYVVGLKDNITREQFLGKAASACHSNRRTISLLVMGSLIFQDFVTGEQLIWFREDIDRTIYTNNILRKSFEPEDETKPVHEAYNRLGLYTDSENRRRDTLQALVEGDMQKAQELLVAAMDKAISTKTRVLAKVN